MPTGGTTRRLSNTSKVQATLPPILSLLGLLTLSLAQTVSQTFLLRILAPSLAQLCSPHLRLFIQEMFIGAHCDGFSVGYCAEDRGLNQTQVTVHSLTGEIGTKWGRSSEGKQGSPSSGLGEVWEGLGEHRPASQPRLQLGGVGDNHPRLGTELTRAATLKFLWRFKVQPPWPVILGQRVANYSLQVKSAENLFVNKALLEHNHARLFTYYLWLLSARLQRQS